MNENKIDESALKADSINGIPAKYIDKLNDEQLQAVIDGKNDADKNKRERTALLPSGKGVETVWRGDHQGNDGKLGDPEF